MLTWLPDMQELTLVDQCQAGALGGFSLGMIEKMERLCLLCPGCRRATGVVSAWIQCMHCDKLLTRLMESRKELLNFSVDLWSGLCTEQLWKTEGGLEVVAKGRVESEAGGSPAKKSDIRKERWKSASIGELEPGQ